MGVRRCLARFLTSLALMRTPKSANGPRSNSFRPDSPLTTTSPRGRKTQLVPPPHRTWSVPDASSQPQLNTETTPYHTKLSGIKTGDILPALIPLNLLFTSFPLMSTEIIAHIFQRAFFKAADLGLADMDFFRHFGLCFAFKKTHVYDMAFPLREPLHGFIQ